MIPVVNPYIISGGGPPPQEPSYWNGTDDTIEELLGTQWGLTNVVWPGNAYHLHSGLVEPLEPREIVTFDAIGPGHIFWLSANEPMAVTGVFPDDGSVTIEDTEEADLYGWRVFKVTSVVSFSGISLEPFSPHWYYRLWDMDPR